MSSHPSSLLFLAVALLVTASRTALITFLTLTSGSLLVPLLVVVLIAFVVRHVVIPLVPSKRSRLIEIDSTDVAAFIQNNSHHFDVVGKQSANLK